MRLLAVGLFALPALALFVTAAPAQTTFTVTATTDTNSTGTGVGSGASGDLRYCIDQANALNLSGGSATINFSLPANSTITIANLLPPLNLGRSGQRGGQ